MSCKDKNGMTVGNDAHTTTIRSPHPILLLSPCSPNLNAFKRQQPRPKLDTNLGSLQYNRKLQSNFKEKKKTIP